MKYPSLILSVLSLLFSSAALAQTSPRAAARNTSPAGAALAPEAAARLQKRAEDFLRNLYAWGPEFDVKAGQPAPSPIPGLYQINVQVTLQDQSDSATVYVTQDGRYMVRGEISDMDADPFAETRSKLTLDNAPSRGPADAKYVLVEFGDFQCPSCRQLEYILRDILANNPQVRLVFKDFPLEQIHPWAMTAALIGRCAFQQSPEGFWKLHDAIYDNQEKITTDAAFDKLLQLGADAGLDSAALKACAADPQTSEQVRKSIQEGLSVGVEGTPTTFVNGRTVVGPNASLLRRLLTF